MNAVTRKDVEKLFKKETESVAGKYGERFHNEQEALGTLISEWEESRKNFLETKYYYTDLKKSLITHEDPEHECMYLIESVAETIQELTQVGAACYKILKGYKGENRDEQNENLRD